ncbi:unnamed protein product [Protopolystoma xenopodis]|uniref:Uncharacterized protein n=1 Tax=Protopolystoma xenopodis TaxID=117903 RepID=A0A448XR00_9PLAT|nr:unnamed protein product [Protopolystoma xenopodis]
MDPPESSSPFTLSLEPRASPHVRIRCPLFETLHRCLLPHLGPPFLLLPSLPASLATGLNPLPSRRPRQLSYSTTVCISTHRTGASFAALRSGDSVSLVPFVFSLYRPIGAVYFSSFLCFPDQFAVVAGIRQLHPSRLQLTRVGGRLWL